MAFDSAPRGWALCDGQILPIARNQALFSLLGTTFALPDLRGRVALHAGNGPGLSTRRLGERGGAESNQISVAQLRQRWHRPEAVSPSATCNRSSD